MPVRQAPAIAIVANAPAPYRISVHRRIVRELPEVRLWSLFTHAAGIPAWDADLPPQIRPVQFGRSEPASAASSPRRALYEFGKGGRVIRWLREHDIRAVMVNGYNDPGRLRIIRWCRARRIPTLLWGDSNIDGDHVRGMRKLVKNLVVPAVLRQCPVVLPCGERGKLYFQRYGVDPKRMFFFPVEPDYPAIRDLPAERVEAARRRLDPAGVRRRIVFCARLSPEKRPDLAIDAFTAIAGARPDWDLVLVGAGPLADALKSRVPAGLKDRVIFTGFMGDQSEVSAIYRASDVLALPSDYEPWAVVVNEAAAAGLALVCTSVVGAAVELVRDGINGRLVPPGNLAALTQALLEVTDPARIDALKQASPQVLADWQRRGDPVDGLRKALQFVGVLPQIRSP